MANACVLKLLLFWLLSSPCAFHYLPQAEDIIQGVLLYGKHVLNRRSTEQSLRINVNTQSSPSIETLRADRKRLIVDRLLPEAVAYFGKTLKVRRASSPIRLQRNCESGRAITKRVNGSRFRFCLGECDVETMCGTVRVPATHLDVCRTCDRAQTHCASETAESGARSNDEADFVLYVSAITTSQCKSRKDVFAYAAVCQQEESLDRPVAGFVNFCEERLSSTTHYSHLLAIVKHEIFHALGFSSSLYGYYRAEDGTPLTTRETQHGRPIEKWSDKVVKEVVRDRWRVSATAGSSVRHKVEMIVTPRVLKEVRAHFNCSSLEGAEIENQGVVGQRQTHWEKRLFENEAMTGVFTHNPVFSRLTLALMEDTGWYRANYAMAENLEWGRNAGCLFAQNSCKAWMDEQEKRNETASPYCRNISENDHTRTTCILGYGSVGTCNLVKYNQLLPAEYRYFDSIAGTEEPGYYGGITTLADYCPFIQGVDWKRDGKTVRGSTCKYVNNSLAFERNYALEEYGARSSCFLHARKWTRTSCARKVTAVDWGSGCYAYACAPGGVVLSIMGQSYPCLFSGEKLEVKVLDKMAWLHEGSLICPPCRDLCGETCPRDQTVRLYNSTSDQRSASQQVLVCSSSETNPSLWLVALLVTCLI